MLLDLDDLEFRAKALYFSVHRRSPDALEISLFDDVALLFKNIADEDDNAFGFETTPWHTHSKLYWTSINGDMYEFSPSEVLSGLRSGELLVASRYLLGELKDMWIAHVRGLGEIELYEAGEELRARQVGYPESDLKGS